MSNRRRPAKMLRRRSPHWERLAESVKYQDRTKPRVRRAVSRLPNQVLRRASASLILVLSCPPRVPPDMPLLPLLTHQPQPFTKRLHRRLSHTGPQMDGDRLGKQPVIRRLEQYRRPRTLPQFQQTQRFRQPAARIGKHPRRQPALCSMLPPWQVGQHRKVMSLRDRSCRLHPRGLLWHSRCKSNRYRPLSLTMAVGKQCVIENAQRPERKVHSIDSFRT